VGSSAIPEVVVFGAGRVGSSNDRSANATPLSHIGAILATDGIRLAAVVDPDQNARDAAQRQWEEKTSAAFVQSFEALGGASPEVVALCTPTATRERDVGRALKVLPKILVVEKPIAPSTASARRILRTARAAGVDIRVNYNRRLDPSTTHFRSLFPGAPVSIIARYGKGLANYASHMVDLLDSWFGPVEFAQATSLERPIGDDIGVSFRMQMKSGLDAHVVSLDRLSFDQFEIDFFFEDRQLSYLAGGAERQVRFAVRDLHYRGYAHLSADPSQTWHGQIGGFAELYRAIQEHLSNAIPLGGCRGGEALHVLQVLDGVRKSGRENGRVVPVDESDSLNNPEILE